MCIRDSWRSPDLHSSRPKIELKCFLIESPLLSKSFRDDAASQIDGFDKRHSVALEPFYSSFYSQRWPDLRRYTGGYADWKIEYIIKTLCSASWFPTIFSTTLTWVAVTSLSSSVLTRTLQAYRRGKNSLICLDDRRIAEKINAVGTIAHIRFD